MLMRKSMLKKPVYKELISLWQESIRKAVPTTRKELTHLHPTRVFEYPWAELHCPPKGQILDVGSNLQFSIALAARGFDVVAHHTQSDVLHFGRLFGWEDNNRGGISTAKTFETYSKNLRVILGYLGDMPFLKDESFDRIYCLSVLEHINFGDDIKQCMDGMWRLLRVGGELCITCDWFPNFNPDDGILGFVLNHDLGSYMHDWKAQSQTPKAEVPWYNSKQNYYDGDVAMTEWNHQPLVVYGIVLRKVA